jgi:hypothetical protein
VQSRLDISRQNRERRLYNMRARFGDVVAFLSEIHLVFDDSLWFYLVAP